MAGSRFEYVKTFELPDPLLPGTFMVLRLDGHAFHRSVVMIRIAFQCVSSMYITRLSENHDFAKPNDERALQLMDHAARDVMNEYQDIVLAFGESDEFRSVALNARCAIANLFHIQFPLPQINHVV